MTKTTPIQIDDHLVTYLLEKSKMKNICGLTKAAGGTGRWNEQSNGGHVDASENEEGKSLFQGQAICRSVIAKVIVAVILGRNAEPSPSPRS
jgi:hypothetical protein